MTNPPTPDDGRSIAVVGGAGFVGCNLAHAYASEGASVRIVDNLSRPGSEKNLDWLKATHGDLIDVRLADISDEAATNAALEGVTAIFHLAAQVAVTTSLSNPRADFLANAAGTLNILEYVRTRARFTPILFASTNKVYGCLEHIRVAAHEGRYEPADRQLAARGIGEDQPLALRTPYGCSKGAADQYVLDYARTFGLRAAVLRMSCVYGPHQFGNEDQGWVAHFVLRAIQDSPITIYGDGAQVRDLLHIQDAVRIYREALAQIDSIKGEAFNLGGGPSNAVGLLQLIDELRSVLRRAVKVNHGPWRMGDQPWFVADTSKLDARLGWRAQIGWREGVRDLIDWLRANSEISLSRAADLKHQDDHAPHGRRSA
jgi:CDP-paratose 2-epimerase